ncbi:hypothetical protein Trydic_g11375 [Trypoxylus dichotomus]
MSGEVQNRGILAAKAIVQIRGRFPIQLRNLNNYLLKLTKETLGHFFNHPASTFTIKPWSLPKQLDNLIDVSHQQLTIEQRQSMETLIENQQVVLLTEDSTTRRTSIMQDRIGDTRDANPIRKAAKELP